MTIPEWHEAGLDERDVVNLTQAIELIRTLSRTLLSDAALRSYATHRRTHRVCGPFPAPVARIANRNLYLRFDIEQWVLPIMVGHPGVFAARRNVGTIRHDDERPTGKPALGNQEGD